MIAPAERAGNDDRRADGHSGEEADQQIRQGRAYADGGKGVTAHKIPHDQRIDAVVKVLEELTQNNRNGKKNQLACDAAPCKIDVSAQGRFLPLFMVRQPDAFCKVYHIFHHF